MINKLVLFLVRKKLGVKKDQKFRFSGQETNAVYWFNNEQMCKLWGGMVVPSNVSLNWLLNNECKIIKIGENK